VDDREPSELAPAPPPPEPQPFKLYQSVLGSLALVVAGFVVYFVFQFVGALVVAGWMIAHGQAPHTESAFAPYLPQIIAFSPLASLAIVFGLRLMKQLAPDPREPRASLGVSSIWAIVGGAATIGGSELIGHVLSKVGAETHEQAIIVLALKVCPKALLYGAIAFLGPVGEELLFRRFAFATLKTGTNRFVAYAITALVFAGHPPEPRRPS